MFMDYHKSDASVGLQMKYEPNTAVFFLFVHSFIYSFSRLLNIQNIQKRWK